MMMMMMMLMIMMTTTMMMTMMIIATPEVPKILITFIDLLPRNSFMRDMILTR